jgi:hypothetical protein
MADFQPQVSAPIEQEFPNSEIPAIFADGIMNIANSQHIVKFYFFRFDPSIKNPAAARSQMAAQAILPMDGFINAFAFLEAAVEKLKVQGIITNESLEKARKFYRAPK